MFYIWTEFSLIWSCLITKANTNTTVIIILLLTTAIIMCLKSLFIKAEGDPSHYNGHDTLKYV